MLKKLLSGLFWVLLLNLLIKPFWILGIEVGVQNAVGAEEYGLYTAIFNLAYIFNILLDFGVTSFNTRNIAQHPALIQKHLSGILCIKIMLLGLYLVVTFAAGLLLGYGSRQFYLLLFLSINQFLNSFILYLRSNFEGLLLFRWDSVISILDRAIMIVICGALLWLPRHPSFCIEYFVYAQTAAYLITAATALLVLVRKTGLKRLRFKKAFTLAILKQSAPFALLVLLMASYNRIDPILLQRLAPDGNYQSGIYASAFRLLEALTMISYLVSVPLLPILSKIVKGEMQSLPSVIRLVTVLMLVYSAGAAITLASMDGQLMELLYVEHTDASAAVFRVLVFGIVPISMTYVFGTLLTAGGQLFKLNILATITLAVNIVVNLIAIPRYGALGSAWASLIAQSFMAIAQTILACRIYRLRPRWRLVGGMALFVLLIAGLNVLLAGQAWWLHLLLMVAASILIPIILRIININEIKQILQTNE